MRRLGVAILACSLAVPLSAARAVDASNALARFFSSQAITGDTAHLIATVPKGSTLFVYVPRMSAAVPVVDGAILADTDVIPLLIHDGKIVAVGARANVPAGQRVTAEFTPPKDGRAHLVVPVLKQPGSNPSIAPPEIAIRGGKDSVDKPIDTLAKGQTAALIFFRDAPASGTLSISGPRWKTTAKPIAAKSGETAVLDPITIAQTTKLIVNWWAPTDPATLVKENEPACKHASGAFNFDRERRSEDKRFVAILSACDTPRHCAEFARRDLTAGVRGTAAFEDVPAGRYLLELNYPKLPVVGKAFDVEPRDTTTVDFELKYVTFFGKITRGGKPYHASIFGATSDPDTGEYTAVVTRLPGSGSQELLPCDGGPIYRFVTDEAPKENGAFDIDVPDNKIIVDVHDADSGTPIPKAKVTFGAEMPGRENAMHFAGIAAITDDNGSATIAPVLKTRKIKLCAGREDYESKCEPDFTMDVEEKNVRLDLHKAALHQGRVDAHGPYTRGILVWVSPQTASITEMIREFKDDGSFTYKRPHQPGEVVVFTAADKPLYAFLQPPMTDDPFVITLPAAPVRSFDVSLSETSRETSAWVTLSVGGVPVPLNALNWHLGPRLHALAPLRPGSTLHVTDILATGPIEVILIPTNTVRSIGEVPFAPEAAAFPRQELGTKNAIMFP